MATKYGKKAQSKVKRAMHERKRGTLKSGRSGKKVKSRKQAIAIGLSEARRAGGKVPKKKASSKRKSSSKRSTSSKKRSTSSKKRSSSSKKRGSSSKKRGGSGRKKSSGKRKSSHN